LGDRLDLDDEKEEEIEIKVKEINGMIQNISE
jgi:hypothetical protein